MMSKDEGRMCEVDGGTTHKRHAKRPSLKCVAKILNVVACGFITPHLAYFVVCL